MIGKMLSTTSATRQQYDKATTKPTIYKANRC
jgi:hypothetical protein